ncbi:hypothetical protein L596_017926 [Steinernema carpocapsae]|uniref:Uncharacterized protein n=1 Tax=Steinernema carpocapsae TaxID=34508 RepID=A0A4U5N347_STECR|nr:hypothetical protein L596_017926 [Steinernema carpocapsae]
MSLRGLKLSGMRPAAYLRSVAHSGRSVAASLRWFFGFVPRSRRSAAIRPCFHVVTPLERSFAPTPCSLPKFEAFRRFAPSKHCRSSGNAARWPGFACSSAHVLYAPWLRSVVPATKRRGSAASSILGPISRYMLTADSSLPYSSRLESTRRHRAISYLLRFQPFFGSIDALVQQSTLC